MCKTEMSFQQLVAANFLCLLAICIVASAHQEDYGDGYGTEWLYFISDNGSMHIMNFSNIPADTRNMFFGKAYFHLYTRCNPNNYEELTIPPEETSIESIYFDPSNNTKIITHGWLGSDKSQWIQDMKDAYIRQYDYNIITVDWSELARNPSYVWPALSTRYIGKRISQLIASLKRTYRLEGRSFHLIGHSLGAQIMGYAGMFSEEQLYRVTGLDPARPLFELPYMPSDFRLERSDANFVDIIHTCGGIYGYRNSHGDADFYPNGGTARQPGCEGTRASSEGCSHGRATELYVESIESTVPFTAYPCESRENFDDGKCKTNSTNMGNPVNVASRGDYYLHTKNGSKFAMGDEQNQ